MRSQRFITSSACAIGIAEVTDISPFGIWILHRGEEHFLSFEDFPWFHDAPIKEVFSVVEEAPGHLRWPDLDIDLSLESICNPKAFPMVAEHPASYGKPLPGANPPPPAQEGKGKFHHEEHEGA